MPEIRHVQMTEEEARECGRLALWRMTAPDEDQDRITGETIVQLIRDKSAHFKVIRDEIKAKEAEIEAMEQQRPVPWEVIERFEHHVGGLRKALDLMMNSEQAPVEDGK